MRDVAALQDAFQKAILDGDEAVLDELLDGAREKRDVLFGVYRNAYFARLVEILQNEFQALAAFMGEDDFDAAARAYIAAVPSRHRNARWVGRDLADFLSRTPSYAERPVLGEIARFETALNDAFDAADAKLLAISDLAQVPPDDWAALRFEAQPSARRLDQTTNATAIWSADKAGEPLPEAEMREEPERLIVWRRDATPMFREMSVEEAMLWDEAARGSTFGQLCTLSATYDDPDNAAGRCAGHLVGWINAGMLARAAPAS